MADALQTQEAGGGEGSTLASPDVQDAKPVIEPQQNTEQNEAKKEPELEQIKPVEEVEVEEAKPVEVKQEEAKPVEEVKQEEAKPVEEVKQEEAKPVEEVKQEEAKPVEQVKQEEAKPVEEVKQEEAKPVEQVKQEEAKPVEEVKQEEAKPTAEPVIDQNGNDVEQNSTDTKDTNWQQRETELLKKIEELEKFRNERTEDGFKLELKVREEEIDLLKARVKNLETELQAALSKPTGKNQEIIEKIKLQHEELLSKARGMIFDKTKMVKNQELQIEALTTQVQSLKDINQITKDLLQIRNSEIKAMEDRFAAMEARFKTEKERYGLVLQRAQTSSNINDDLKKEYETQLAIFKELREKYEQRVKALVAENERLKASITPVNTATTSTSPAQ